jgi:hypothetical protein
MAASVKVNPRLDYVEEIPDAHIFHTFKVWLSERHLSCIKEEQQV